MSWVEISLATTAEGLDWVRTQLASKAFSGKLEVRETDERDQVSSGPWPYQIRCYLPWLEDLPSLSRENALTEAEVATIQQALTPLERTGLTSGMQTAIVAHREQSLGDHSPVQRVGDQFVILSPEAAYTPTAADLPIRLPPSLSFGSGLHPTTILSLHLLERHVTPGIKALDLGCGSGILSVAMARLGATVLALDNDSLAVQATQTAIELNRLSDRVTVERGSLGQGCELGHWLGDDLGDTPVTPLPTETGFDLIVANLMARIQIALVQDYRQALQANPSPNRLLITAGFTQDYGEEVNRALAQAGFSLVDREKLDEWIAFVHRCG